MKVKIYQLIVIILIVSTLLILSLYHEQNGTLYIGVSSVFLEDNLEYDCNNLVYIYECRHNYKKLNDIMQSNSFIKDSGIYSHGKIRVKIRYINLLLSTSIACPCCIKDGFPAVFIIDLSPLENNNN